MFWGGEFLLFLTTTSRRSFTTTVRRSFSGRGNGGTTTGLYTRMGFSLLGIEDSTKLTIRVTFRQRGNWQVGGWSVQAGPVTSCRTSTLVRLVQPVYCVLRTYLADTALFFGTTVRAAWDQKRGGGGGGLIQFPLSTSETRGRVRFFPSKLSPFLASETIKASAK